MGTVDRAYSELPGVAAVDATAAAAEAELAL